MRAKICLLSALLLLTLTACGDSETAKGYSYAPPSDDTQVSVADTQEVPDVQEEPAQVITPQEIVPEAEIVLPEENPVHDVEVSAQSATTDDPNVIEISENVFIAQINDIYYNFEDYEDKTIIVEGMYAIFYAWDEQLSCPGVYRNGPGCCGNDSWGGFMLNYDGELPQDNDWIRVTGTPELVTAYDGYVDLFLNVTSIEVMDVRGAEYVAQ